jgi:hypothetical protein
MELHFLVNETMKPIANRHFIPSLPPYFRAQSHISTVSSSGNFAKDGYFEIILDKVECILSLIEGRLDDQLMLWSDVDVVFNPKVSTDNNIAGELESLCSGKDLLFQREFPQGDCCNTGIQIIRRNTRTLIFYAQVRLMLDFFNRSDRSCVNHLLAMVDGVEWGFLPIEYSNESNGGLSPGSRLYHANCTPVDTQRSKDRRLSRAMKLWSL